MPAYCIVFILQSYNIANSNLAEFIKWFDIVHLPIKQFKDKNII
jgi:hypothetical protein